MKLHYFGTSEHSAGHFLHELDSYGLHRSLLRLENIPFNPEALPHNLTHTWGELRCYNVFGYTIMAISGSIKDTRPQSKSIFFVQAEIEFADLEKMIQNTPFGKMVMDKLLSK